MMQLLGHHLELGDAPRKLDEVMYKPQAARMRAEFAPIFRLGRAERLQLVEDLWDSIAEEDAQLPVPAWKREELRRRKERLLREPSAGESWEQVKRRARARHD